MNKNQSNSYNIRKNITKFAELYCNELHNPKRDIIDLTKKSMYTLNIADQLRDKYGEYAQIDTSSVARKYEDGLDNDRREVLHRFLKSLNGSSSTGNIIGSSSISAMADEFSSLANIIASCDYYLKLPEIGSNNIKNLAKEYEKYIDKINGMHSNNGDSISEYLQLRNITEYTIMDKLETDAKFINKSNHDNDIKRWLEKKYGNRLTNNINKVTKASSAIYKLKLSDPIVLAKVMIEYKNMSGKISNKMMSKVKGAKKKTLQKNLDIIEDSMREIKKILADDQTRELMYRKLVISVITRDEKIAIMNHLAKHKKDADKFSKMVEQTNIKIRNRIEDAKDEYISELKKIFTNETKLRENTSLMQRIITLLGRTTSDTDSVIKELLDKTQEVKQAISGNKQYLFAVYVYPLLTEIYFTNNPLYIRVNDDYYLKKLANDLKYVLMGLDTLTPDMRVQRLQQEVLKYQRELEETKNQLNSIKLFLVGNVGYGGVFDLRTVIPTIQKERDDYEKRIQKLQDDIQMITAKFENYKENCEKGKLRVNDENANISKATINSLEDEIERLKEELTGVKREKKGLERLVESMQIQMRELENKSNQQMQQIPPVMNLPPPIAKLPPPIAPPGQLPMPPPIPQPNNLPPKLPPLPPPIQPK